MERRKLTVTEAKDFFKDDKNKPQEGFDRPPTVAWKPDATKYDKPIAKQLTKALESKPQPKPEAKPKAITETPKPQPTEAQPTQPEVQPKTAKPKTAKPKEAKEYTDVATLSAAAKFAKSLGVQMKFDAKAKLVYKAGSETAKRRLLRATNDTNKAMEMCAALGLPLPPTVLVGPNKFHKIAPGREDDVLGAYNTFDKTFFVNSIAASLDNMAKEMEGMKKLNHLSTSHPLHVPIHELGHAAHHANVMQELAESEVRTFWNDKRNSSVDNGSPLRSWVKREVSIYGQTRLTEFVAETFVKLVTGEHVSDEALALYKECKGAIPTRTKK